MPQAMTHARHWRDVAAVVAVSLAASIAGIGNDFAFDDLHLIRDNARIQDLSSWATWFTTSFWPPPYSQDLYRPLTSALLAFEFVIGAGAPLAFRVASYALYALCAVVFYVLAERLVPRPVAVGAALLFAAHPVHVEAVALAVGQSELVVAILIMAASARYLARRRDAEGLRRRDWVLLAATYAAASLTKEQGLLLPGFLLLVELYFVAAPWRTRARDLALGYAALLAIGIAVLVARHAALGELAGTFTAEALVGLGIGGRALTMLRVVPHWMRLIFWPQHLRADYSPGEIVAATGFGALEALGLACLVAAVATWWLTRRRAPVVSFGIAWAALALLPVSNVLVPTGIVLAERTLLLPSAGAMLAIAAGAWALVAHATPPRAPSDRFLRSLRAACAVLVVLGVARSIERQRVWRNDAIFIARGVQDAPRSFRMQQSYAELLFEVHLPKLANEAYGRALAFAPAAVRWRVHNDYARALAAEGRITDQANELAASLAERADQDLTRGQLIVALLTLGRYGDAAAQADSGLAHGGPPDVFRGLRVVADSAERAHAPPGSIAVVLHTGAFAPSR
jgi:hypothetical protein